MSKIPEDTEKRVSPEFQQRLKDLISDEECTKKEFASAVGISKDVIIRATLYGIIPSLQSLIKIADHLDISLDYLLAETDDRSFLQIRKSYNLSYKIRIS
ncbi:MAG: helix-turn-helix domain-containing protein [Coprobacter sp.]